MTHRLLFITLLFCTLLVTSCSNDDEEECSNCQGPPTTGFFFYGVIDGEEVIVAGQNATGTGVCATDVLTYAIGGGTWLSNPFDLESVTAGVSIVKGFSNFPDANQIYDMFTEGDYAYGLCGDVDGVEIIWVDDAGTTWTSVGDQGGSTFTITSRGTNNGLTTEVEGEFNCKLYSGNQTKTLSSGEFSFLVGLF